MKKIVLTIASLLFASSMAFAGSDHFGSDPIAAAGNHPNTHSMVSGAKAVDMKTTKSIATDSKAAGNSTYDIPVRGYGQGIWGR